MKGFIFFAFMLCVLGCGKAEKAAEIKPVPEKQVVTESEAEVPVVASTKHKEIKIPSSDKKFVFAELSPCEGGKDAPIVLMFHQAGSNRGEYQTITPKLVKEGYNCLAVDQRSGGTMWGRDNPTAKQFSGEQDYDSAYEDLLATLNWAKREEYSRIIVWGSSYSASLVLKLAAESDGISEVICASPGDYINPSGTTQLWAKKVTEMTFIVCTKSESKVAGEIFDAIATEEKSFLEQDPGVHGSSAFIAAKNNKSEEAWKSLLDFLGSLPEQEGEPEPAL